MSSTDPVVPARRLLAALRDVLGYIDRPDAPSNENAVAVAISHVEVARLRRIADEAEADLTAATEELWR